MGIVAADFPECEHGWSMPVAQVDTVMCQNCGTMIKIKLEFGVRIIEYTVPEDVSRSSDKSHSYDD